MKALRFTFHASRIWDDYFPGMALDITEAEALVVPPVTTPGLVLGGKLPHWLWTALARVYQPQWMAVCQPQAGGAVVVATQTPAVPPGTLVPE